MDQQSTLNDLLTKNGFQQVTPALQINLCNITDPVTVETVAYSGQVCALPQSYQVFLDLELGKYPEARGVYTFGYVYQNHAEPKLVCELVAQGQSPETLTKMLGLGKVTLTNNTSRWSELATTGCVQSGRETVQYLQKNTNPLELRTNFYQKQPTSVLFRKFTRTRVTSELEEYLEADVLSQPRLGAVINLQLVKLNQGSMAIAPQPALVSAARTTPKRTESKPPPKPKPKPMESIPTPSLEANMKDLADFVKSTQIPKR